jgi:hypothetical protein
MALGGLGVIIPVIFIFTNTKTSLLDKLPQIVNYQYLILICCNELSKTTIKKRL